jgi:hypothetical protein
VQRAGGQWCHKGEVGSGYRSICSGQLVWLTSCVIVIILAVVCDVVCVEGGARAVMNSRPF